MDLSDLRLSYTSEGLHEANLDADPLKQFGLWFDQARTACAAEPNAMCLSTADPSGAPSARMVLLKAYSEAGFVFFTNRASAKAKELETNRGQASLLFYWPELHRQVRIRGIAGPLPAEEADTYFAQRPRGHQLGAWASNQSEAVTDRATLERDYQRYEAKFMGASIPRPDHWGGYRVAPQDYEFWQGRENRLHDRIAYRREANRWIVRRLAP